MCETKRDNSWGFLILNDNVSVGWHLCVNLIDSPVLVGVGSLIKTHMGAVVDHGTPSRVIVVDDYNVFRILRYYVNQEWVEVVRFNHAPFFVRDTFFWYVVLAHLKIKW